MTGGFQEPNPAFPFGRDDSGFMNSMFVVTLGNLTTVTQSVVFCAAALPAKVELWYVDTI